MKRIKIRLSDRQLDTTIRWTKRLSYVSTSGASIWGGVAVIGGAALLLNTAGVGIPAIIGVSTIATGSLLALKALAVRSIYKVIHKKSVKAKENRIREREEKAKALAPAIDNTFNNEASPQQQHPVVPPSVPSPFAHPVFRTL